MIKRTLYFFLIARVSPDSFPRQPNFPEKGFQIPTPNSNFSASLSSDSAIPAYRQAGAFRNLKFI
jgi:hypothetical protein